VYLPGGIRWSLKDSELVAGNNDKLAAYLAERSSVTVEYPDTVVDMPDPAEVARRQRGILLACIALALLIGGLALAREKLKIPPAP
jgi:hypothetical protein